MDPGPTAIEANRLKSIENRARDVLTEEAQRLLPIEFSEADNVDTGRLWRGIAVAAPFAAAFWVLVWFAVSRMLHV